MRAHDHIVLRTMAQTCAASRGEPIIEAFDRTYWVRSFGGLRGRFLTVVFREGPLNNPDCPKPQCQGQTTESIEKSCVGNVGENEEWEGQLYKRGR
jgi:hypothetical protein